MEDFRDLIRLAVLLVAAVLLFSNYRFVKDAIEAFKNNFPRGGPPTPMHPSPVADSALLRRRWPSRDNG